jgi:hypothetical protein
MRIALTGVTSPILLSEEAAAMEDAEYATRPATIGDLRQRLRSLGEPWTVPARFNDDDPLPDLPPQLVETGHIEGLRAVNTREEFEACLREVPLVNPFLAARWRELGTPVPGSAAGAPDGGAAPASGQGVPEWGVG